MKQDQMMMGGIDTMLSIACDELIERRRDLQGARDNLDKANKNLADIMRKSKRRSLKHAGVRIILREGRTIKDNIVVKIE